MKKDYSVYKFYKGEKENPFEKILEAHEIDKSNLPPPECMKTEYDKTITYKKLVRLENSSGFWELECLFERFYLKRNDVGRENLFDGCFQKRSDNGSESKKYILNLWFEYLVKHTEKLEQEHLDWYNNFSV